MESLVIFVVILLAVITITAPLTFVLTTRKVQEFTAARGWLNLLRQIVGGLIATIGIVFAVITGLGVSGIGIRLFFIAIIALNIYSIIREVRYIRNRRNK
jgi:choline-glycine betaine transporter